MKNLTGSFAVTVLLGVGVASAQVVIDMPAPKKVADASVAVISTGAIAASTPGVAALQGGAQSATPAASPTQPGPLALARYAKARRGPLYSYGPSRTQYGYRSYYGPTYYGWGWGSGWGWPWTSFSFSCGCSR